MTVNTVTLEREFANEKGRLARRMQERAVSNMNLTQLDALADDLRNLANIVDIYTEQRRTNA